MVGGFGFWGEGLLVGGYVPSWCRSRLVGRRKGVGCSRCCDHAPSISSSRCVQPFHQSVCAAVHTAGPPRWKRFPALIRSRQYKLENIPWIQFLLRLLPIMLPILHLSVYLTYSGVGPNSPKTVQTKKPSQFRPALEVTIITCKKFLESSRNARETPTRGVRRFGAPSSIPRIAG